MDFYDAEQALPLQTDDSATTRGFQYPGYAASNARISSNGQPASVILGNLVFSDGFESGDTAAWSAAVP